MGVQSNTSGSLGRTIGNHKEIHIEYSLKLQYFNNPKGVLVAHIKENYMKGGFIHEDIPNESIYNGVDTIPEVFSRAKSKEEHSLILHYQKELRDRIQSYRELELDLLEKVRKNNEEKEV